MKRRILTLAISIVVAMSIAAAVNTPRALAWYSIGCKWSKAAIGLYVPSPLVSYPVWSAAATSWNGLHAHFDWNANSADVTGTNEARGNTVSWTGITRRKGTTQDPPACSSGYFVSGQVEVVLNWSLVSDYSAAKRQGAAAHELGHVFGLAHNATTTAVLMFPGDNRTVTTPQSDDKAGVNALY